MHAGFKVSPMQIIDFRTKSRTQKTLMLLDKSPYLLIKKFP